MPGLARWDMVGPELDWLKFLRLVWHACKNSTEPSGGVIGCIIIPLNHSSACLTGSCQFIFTVNKLYIGMYNEDVDPLISMFINNSKELYDNSTTYYIIHSIFVSMQYVVPMRMVHSYLSTEIT